MWKIIPFLIGNYKYKKILWPKGSHGSCKKKGFSMDWKWESIDLQMLLNLFNCFYKMTLLLKSIILMK